MGENQIRWNFDSPSRTDVNESAERRPIELTSLDGLNHGAIDFLPDQLRSFMVLECISGDTAFAYREMKVSGIKSK